MIVCPNCDHHNPEGATQCEACYTPLPEMVPCPNCGAPVQVDANFCGQCGFNIQAPAPVMPPAVSAAPVLGNDLPTALEAPGASPGPAIAPSPILPTAEHELEALDVEAALAEEFDLDSDIDPEGGLDFEADLGAAVEASAALGPTAETPAVSSPPAPTPGSPPTQLQLPRAKLLHIRSNVTVDLPESLSVVHLGKANDRIPPDIDVTGFPDSEVVSRVHADIRVEGDAYYIEDLGSSNGTYVNNLPLVPGNRHRLRVGDRISLGKGDLVTFLFQVA
ncbi:MAG: FHA domain-containing protein [Synechococcales cyanobacterium RM1_1_8]|nr:FHA domain-containing protein [Synechococcales cyanobacterium RM1_1_8]